MAVRRYNRAWYVVLGGILAAFLAIVTIFEKFAWALPWTAADKTRVEALHQKVDRMEGKIDILLEACRECRKLEPPLSP
jgi:hypothetical protein